MRILILGGTGFIGPHQVDYALARGHEVTLFHRGSTPAGTPRSGVEHLHGDRSCADLRALGGRTWDVCIDNSASLPAWVRDSTRALAGNVGHYVFVSTISVYENMSLPLSESAATAPYAGKDPYAETVASLRASAQALYGPLKALCELEVMRQFPDSALIVRPGLIAGPGDPTDRFTYWVARLRHGGNILAPGTWEDAVQFIDARDLAEWMVRLAEQRVSGILNATGPECALTMGPFLTRLRQAIGSDAAFTWVSSRFIALQGLEPWTDLPLWLPARGSHAGLMRVDNTAALRAGLTFRDLAQTANETLAWLDRQPASRRAELRAGLSEERERRALEAWKAEVTSCDDLHHKMVPKTHGKAPHQT